MAESTGDQPPLSDDEQAQVRAACHVEQYEGTPAPGAGQALAYPNLGPFRHKSQRALNWLVWLVWLAGWPVPGLFAVLGVHSGRGHPQSGGGPVGWGRRSLTSRRCASPPAAVTTPT